MSYKKNHVNHAIMGYRRRLNTRRKVWETEKDKKVHQEIHKSAVTDDCQKVTSWAGTGPESFTWKTMNQN